MLEEAALPKELGSIGERVFAGCRSLEGLELPDGIANIPDGAFEGCTRLRLGAIPAGVTNIGACAFRETCLERAEVPGGVEAIGDSAFRDCSRLRMVALGEGVKELGNAAFKGCSALWEFVMPDSIERAGKSLLSGCSGLVVLAVPDKFAREESFAQFWQVPRGCTILLRTEWKEARQGTRTETAIDPFYGVYAGEDLETVAFEGTVLAASAIPDPSKNDYDSCLYALLVDLDSVLSTTPLSSRIERVVLVNTPIMKDRTPIGQNAFEPGTKIACTAAEYDAMPQEIQEIQLSDDIQSFEHQQYYPLKIKQVAAFQKKGNKNFAKREISVLPIQSLPRDENAVLSRRERIQKEIRRVESELAGHGGSFEAWREEYRPIAEKYRKLREKGYAGWIQDSYFACGDEESTYMTKEYIEFVTNGTEVIDSRTAMEKWLKRHDEEEK